MDGYTESKCNFNSQEYDLNKDGLISYREFEMVRSVCVLYCMKGYIHVLCCVCVGHGIPAKILQVRSEYMSLHVDIHGREGGIDL